MNSTNKSDEIKFPNSLINIWPTVGDVRELFYQFNIDCYCCCFCLIDVSNVSSVSLSPSLIQAAAPANAAIAAAANASAIFYYWDDDDHLSNSSH